MHFKPYFNHPIANDKVYIFFDAFHMIKLIRNCLENKVIIIDKDRNKIFWRYIKEFYNIQKKEGLHLATN